MPSQLKIWISKVNTFKRYFFLGIAVLLGLSLSLWLGLVKLQQNDQVFSDVTEAKTYSLSGMTKSVSEEQMVIEVGIVVKERQANKLKYNDYTVYYGDGMEIYAKTADPEKPFASESKERLMSAKEVIVYSQQNPYDNQELTANRIDIMD